MSLDEMKTQWSQVGNDKTVTTAYDQTTIDKIVKSRVKKHTNTAFQYFWGAFVLQIMVYAMLAHVIIKYWYEPMVTIWGLIGIAIFIPFTIVLMKRFKKMAFTTPTQGAINSYVVTQHEVLESFYRFKKRYELVLIPLATFIGTFLVFELYVPGGVFAYLNGAMITFFISLASCIIAIQAENKKNFRQPLEQLQSIINELRSPEL